MNTLPFEVSIEYPLYQSRNGFYFIGQTPILSGQTGHALALLRNPTDSCCLLVLNAVTLTNLSDKNLSAEFYLRSQICHTMTSELVTCTNTALCQVPPSNGLIEYKESPTSAPSDGISIFSRIVSPYSTLVVDGGQIILGPSEAISVYIGGFSTVTFNGIRFAFGWSEECCCN